MKIVFLGTNGWYSSKTGDTPCIFIDTKDHYIVLDAGNGIYKLDNYIKEDKPISLFISHFHLDHVSGVHTLIPGSNFKQGVNIYVGSERKKDLDTIAGAPFTWSYKHNSSTKHSPQTKFNAEELSDGIHDLGFQVEVIELNHGYRDHGYKFNVDGKVISYTGDCAPDMQAEELAKDSDVFICESSWKKSDPKNSWGHFNPTDAAEMAKKTGVKKLFLTHFDAGLYKTDEDRNWAEKEAKKVFSNTTAARDGMEFEI